MIYSANFYRSIFLKASKSVPKMRYLAIVTFIFTFALSLVGNAQDPFIPKYDAVKRSERCFTVTWETNNQFGAVWWADKVDFSQDTSFNFVVYMGDRDGNGADGLAFVMHQDPRDTITDTSEQVIIGGAGTWDLQAATGDDGGGLGFAMHESRVGPNTIPGPHGPGDDPENHKIQRSVAVELDTWNNEDVPDGNIGTDANGVSQPTSPYYGWDHTAVIYNGDLYGEQQIIEDAEGNTGRILPIKPSYAFGSANNPDGSAYHNIEDDRCYMFQIKWIVNPDGTQTLQLWADVYNGSTNTDGLQMIMTHTDDMINNVFGGNSVMRFGFTGSTGGSINEQTICLLGENLKPFANDDYASIPLNTSTVVDVEANDNDPDGDQLHVPVIIDPAKHGQAVIFDSLNTNFMRYTPNTGFVGLDTISYVTCDVNSIKCYAKCDTAFVYINVGCIPFDVDLTAISPNLVCTDSVPANGIASANVDATFIRGTVWYEGFEDSHAQQTEDTGPSSWTTYKEGSNCSPGNNLYAQNFEFRTKVVTGTDCELVFETGEIDISTVSNACISIDFKTSNATYESDDYIESYFILDGGPETMFDVNGRLDGTFGIKKASTCGLNGSTLKIVVRTKSNHSSEEYSWDNIHVTAIGAGVPDVTYNWYKGPTASGSIIYEGAVNNSLNSGTYTVIAYDNATGCPSNPATITIDSAGYRVPGGFIEQLSPFTNCQLPYDGALGAGVIDGTDTLIVGYNFDWYFQEDPTTIRRTGAIAQNLESREYTVIITEIATGCDTTISANVPNAVTIPTVTATKISDVTSCTDPNTGAGAANVGGVTNGYRFEWYAGPSIGSGSPDYTGPNVTTFPEGTYTVQAIDSTTFCPSDPASITINDLTALPVIIATVDSEQISCDPAAPTGQLSGAVDESGTLTTTGYSFNWYKGPNDIIPARPGYSGGPTADSLEAGPYRLVVVENGTNCTSFLDTLIQDMTVTPPDITLASTDVTSCAAPNGQITVTLDASLNPADFEFEVYKGNGIIADSLLLTSPTNLIQNLAAGNYTVIAVNIATSCASGPVTATISDVTVDPDANIASLPQVSCAPGVFTGSLTAAVTAGALTDYTFTWFDDGGNPIVSSSPNGEVISNLDSGDYEVRITNNTSQCVTTHYPTVNIAQVFPVETVSAVASTYCAPNGNGVLTGGVQGQVAPFTGYTFIWESATDSVATSANTYTGLEPDDYTLQVQDDNTKCLSNIAPVTVYESTVTPIPTLIPTDNTSCDINNPNGQIEVTTTNEDPTYSLGDYSYAWFEGATPVATTGGANGEIANSLDAGTYELQILNTITRCSNSTLALINDINIKPVIDNVNVTDATRCADPYMSGAEVTSISGSVVLTDFTFTWVNTDLNDTLLSASASPIITDATDTDGFEMPLGNYEVTAFNNYGCPSDPVTFVVGDNTTPPVFTLSANNNISCSALPVGSLVASRPGDSYTISQYEWMDGLGNQVSAPTTVDSTLLNLSGGLYSVRITESLTECTSVEYASIQNTPASNPIIQNISISHLTRCDIENGELGYQVFPYDSLPPLNLMARSYTFYLTDGTNSYNLNTTGVSDNVNFVGLGSGDWDAYVVDDFTHCQSMPITNNLTDAPEIIITTTINKKPASCLGNDGEALVTVESIDGTNKDPLGPGFDFSWFVGTDTSTTFVPNLITLTDWAQEANNLEAIYYTVKVHDRNTQCEKDTTFYVPPDVTPVFLNVIPIDATQCIPGNGALTAEIDPTTVGAGKDFTDYYYIMFEGPYVDLAWPGPGSTEYILVDGDTIDLINGIVDFGNEIEPGTYVIIAQEKIGSKCFGEAFILEIDLDFDFPEFAFSITPDRSCSGGTGTGQAVENAPSLVGNIDYSWHIGIDASTGSISSTNSTPATSYAGPYYLTSTVTANIPNTSNGGTAPGGLGCVQDSISIIPKVLDNLRLAASGTDNNNCAPYDGTIQISDVVINNVASGLHADFADYSIVNSSMNPPSPFPAGDGTLTPWSGLAPGIYYLQARNTTTNCSTNYYQIEIDDLATDPVIAVAVNSTDFACDPLLANGELEAFSTGNSQNTAEYNFTWYSNSVAAGNIISNVPLASNLTANSSTQLYIIEIEDIAGTNLGCKSLRPITLTHQPTTVSILSSNIVSAPQTICGPNGEVQITSIRETINSSFTDYGFPFTNPPSPIKFNAELLNSSLGSLSGYYTFNQTTGSFEDGSGDVDSIAAGTYYVRALNASNGCSYGPITQVIIKDVSRKPIISAILNSPDYACFAPDPGNPGHTGQLLATAVGGSDGIAVTTDFTVQWTRTSDGTNVATSGSQYNAVELWPDMYTLTVVDNTGPDQGCISTRDYIVPIARHSIEVFASGGDQTICNPDGQVQIDGVEVDGVAVPTPESISLTGFLLNDARTNQNAPESGFISDPDPFSNIMAGTYFVRVQDNLTKCYSNDDQVVIHDASTDPVIAMSVDNPQWSLNPNPLSWTGALSAQVQEVNGTPGIYNYEWYQGTGTSNSMNQQTIALDSLDKGNYTFTAQNTATGCISNYYIYLPYEYLEPAFLTTLTPKTVCAPNNGSIEVTDIALDGNADDLDDYTFDFYHSTYSTGDAPDTTVPGDNSGTSYSNINTDSYYIIARENWWWVESYPVKVDIVDSTSNPIINFDLTDYHPVTSCDESVFADGALGINVSEDTNNPYVQNGPYDYSYTWISEATGQVIPGETSNIIEGLRSGEYTVLVVNLDNNCEAQSSFIIDDESTTPVVAVSQSPNTNCVVEIANGIANANVINSTNTYYFRWYEGTSEGSTPGFQGDRWYGLPGGFYTVVAVDQELSTCKSIPVTVEVKDMTKDPVLVVNEVSPVTNCDPERPNGVMSAVTEEGVSGHTFRWFLDGELVSTGPLANDLGLFKYELVVTNNVTLCETRMLAGPTELLGIVPPPEVDVLSDRTSCLYPDGVATASISGNVVNYIFRYYNKFSGYELSNLFQDYKIYDLDTSTYLVTAENRNTGCISEPTEFAIANETYFPEIDVIAVPSSCMDPTGEANVIISDMSRDFSVTWIGDNGFEAQEKELVFIPIGKYLVIVEGTDGCITEAEAEIKGDVVIYNAISANNDGLNEFFQILCMEYFLNNNVKIYNRAGLLVYEQNYYDPTDPSRRFEGLSNKGASIAGTELPIGTYFYVVDKSDGSKPKVGYLELNR
jgi:hypothetical protein